MRNLITITAILAGLLFTTTAIASPQEQTIPEPTPTIIAETPTATPTPEPEETQTPPPTNQIEAHSYGFHNTGCPEGNSLYEIGDQTFSTIWFQTVQPSCALLGIRLEAFIPCPYTHAWVRSTPVGTSNTTTPTQLTINRSCQQAEQPATPPPPPTPPLPEQPQTIEQTTQPTTTIE
jgi:hypothetical protein